MHKTKGNELFKLGRFGDADAAYSQAIAALPSGTLALVPLFNNRAAARLKNGDERTAAEDCTEVVNIVLSGAMTSRVDFAALEREVMPAEVKDLNLRDQLSKALSKRAKAYEALEKWTKAGEDWATLLQGGEAVARSAGGAKLISEGAARCRKMANAETGPPASTAGVSAVAARRQAQAQATAPVKRPIASRPKPAAVSSGEAVRALKAAGAAADAEEDLRMQLKDSVDGRITAWKGGKETNLRALIASLDNVLWPELGWKTVGMHELISEGQLKVRYVRAIGKVHPDKVSF